MNQRRHITAVAAGATLLASMPLANLFDRWTWLVNSTLVVCAASGMALLVRTLRVPGWLSTPAAVVGFLAALCLRFPSGHEVAGILPASATFTHWIDLFNTAGQEMRELSIPVDDHDGLLFLTAVGIGAVAILVDVFAVVLRRPALAGLPMLAIYSVPVAVQTDSVSVLPFIAGAFGFLWLLVTDNVDRMRRFGRRFTADGRDVDLWEPSPLSAAGRRLAVTGVLLAVLVPLAVPGMTSGILDRYGTGGGTGTGGRGSVTVNLYAQLRGILNQDKPYEMVRVTTDDPEPYYLRFGVAGEATEAGFRGRPPFGGQPVTSGLPNPTIAGQDGVRQSSFHARVQIVNLDMGFLPVYLEPTRTEKLDASWLYDRAGHTIYSNRGTSKKKTYSFDYVRTDYTAAALRNVPPLERDQLTLAYTGLPRRYDEVTAAVQPLIANKTNQYDKVMAILQYFSAQNGFVYSLQTGSATNESPIVDFLRNKKGFCEQYSAAMAWLLRAADIPARVAFGFTRGRSVTGDTYSLTNENLHAWTEVYFGRLGWVPFDPTPAVAVPGSVAPPWQRTDSPTAGPGNGSADQGRGDTPESAASGGASRPPDDPNQSSVPATTTRAGLVTQWRFWALVGAFVVLALLMVAPLWRAILRRRRWPDTPPVPDRAPDGSPDRAPDGSLRGPAVEGSGSSGRHHVNAGHAAVGFDDPATAAERRRAHAAWDELIDTMVDHRLELDAAATPRVVAERLADQAWLSGAEVASARLLGHAEERARYAPEPLRGDELGAALKTVRRAIPKRLSRSTRLVAILMPPSVLGHWRNAAARGAMAVAAGATRRGETVRHAVNPRRAPRGRG